jgi:hypothetical protein
MYWKILAWSVGCFRRFWVRPDSGGGIDGGEGSGNCDCRSAEKSTATLTHRLPIQYKEHGGSAHQSVIALTAHARRGDREKRLPAGMDGYLKQTIFSQELDELLEG